MKAPLMQFQEVKETPKDKSQYQPLKSALVATPQAPQSMFSHLEHQSKPSSFRDA